MSYQSTILADSPIHYFLLNETSGTVANDLGSLAHNGTINGGFTQAPGLVADSSRQCMQLNGSGQYISIPTTGMPTGNAPITLECIVKFPIATGVPTAGTYGVALAVGANSSHANIALYFGDAGTGGNILDVAIHGDGSVSGAAAALNNRNIYHWAATYDGSTLILYLNGANVGQTSTSLLNLSYGVVNIGRDPSGAGLDFFGQISDCAIYNAALSPAQIAAHNTALRAGGTSLQVAAPTDGYYIYEDCDPTDAAAHARLDKIAAGGFKGVLNYDLLSANTHIADVTGYINYAATKGLKVIVPLSANAIWKTPAIQANFPLLYTDSGNQSTEAGFTAYIVNQTKGLSGTWGYYVADEPASGDHAACLTHANTIKTNTALPRLIVGAAEQFTNNFWSSGGPFVDCCDVGGDDYYPIGDDVEAALTQVEVFAGIQKQCTFSGIQSCVVLQSMNWLDWVALDGQTCSPWPSCAVWPSRIQERNQKLQALLNMSPRLILWFSYMDIWGSGSTSAYSIAASSTPDLHWADLLSVLHGSQILGNHKSLARIR